MKLNKILTVLEEVAPVALSDEFCAKYHNYDNSGIIVDCKREITGAVFSLDLSKGAIDEAKKRGYNLIVTHHPAIFGGISRLSRDDLVADCLINGISVISMHLNFDAAPEGIDYHLMRGLGGAQAEIFNPLQGGGYGRVYAVEKISFSALKDRVEKTFSTRRALFYGAERQVGKIASFCGAGCSSSAIAFAVSCGADVFVSSDMKHHEIASLLTQGVNVIHLTHYSAENYGFNKIYSQISNKTGVPAVYFTDKELL